jgi:hypothetical protein
MRSFLNDVRVLYKYTIYYKLEINTIASLSAYGNASAMSMASTRCVDSSAVHAIHIAL